VSVTGPTGSVGASVAVVNGAVAYAWFWGAARAEVLGAITTINPVSITANATGTQPAAGKFGADDSREDLVFDGFLTQIMEAGSGAYNVALPTGVAGTGTKLTGDGAGGVTQVDAALSHFWENYRLSPDVMEMSGATLLAMNAIVIANGGAPLIRMDAGSGGVTLTAGTVIESYLNKITNTKVTIRVHPDATDGVIMFRTRRLPYALSGVANPAQMKLRREYYALNWPRRSRKEEFGVYFDGVLQNYFPPAFGVLKNIAVK